MAIDCDEAFLLITFLFLYLFGVCVLSIYLSASSHARAI